MKTFRFDDICINADMKEVNRITDYLLTTFDCEVIWAISPLVSDNVGERVFPKILGAFSDVRVFYFPDKSGIPKLRKDNSCELRECKKCGEPSRGDLCNFCKIIGCVSK